LRTVSFSIVPFEDGWGVSEDGAIAGPYLTKEAALEAALGPMMNEIKRGSGIKLTIPGTVAGESTLGTPPE
jgi:hypothetical protein